MKPKISIKPSKWGNSCVTVAPVAEGQYWSRPSVVVTPSDVRKSGSLQRHLMSELQSQWDAGYSYSATTTTAVLLACKGL